MDFIGKVVIHKAWGSGIVSRHDASGFYVCFGQEEKRFSYPDSFAVFLRFEDPQLQEEPQKLLLQKDEAKRKIIVAQHALDAAKQAKGATERKQKKKLERNNIVFKCNFCDGGCNKKHLGYMGACSDEMIWYNIEVAKHSWCSDPNCACNQYYYGEIDGTTLDNIFKEYGSVCHESHMLIDWIASAGFVLNGEKREEPKKIRNIQLNSLAVLTTRLPDSQEKDRIVFGVFLVDDGDEGNHENDGFVKSSSKYRIELSPEEAQQIKFWNYHSNDNNPEKPAWGQGLYRYIDNVEAVQILRDIVAVKRIPREKRLAEEFLAYFCKSKKISLSEIPELNGALKR